jgi:hypothetical protein
MAFSQNFATKPSRPQTRTYLYRGRTGTPFGRLASDGTFGAAANFGVNGYPYSVTVGDFNGDGRADLAVVTSSGNVSVLMGNGDGTFRTAVNYGVGSGPQSVTVGDFNGDGRADLAVANTSDGTVSVLSGNGDGTFRTAVNYSVGAGSGSIAVGAFKGDGRADLAVATSAGVSILLDVAPTPDVTTTKGPVYLPCTSVWWKDRFCRFCRFIESITCDFLIPCSGSSPARLTI